MAERQRGRLRANTDLTATAANTTGDDANHDAGEQSTEDVSSEGRGQTLDSAPMTIADGRGSRAVSVTLQLTLESAGFTQVQKIPSPPRL